jgi:hypothetical protein
MRLEVVQGAFFKGSPMGSPQSDPGGTAGFKGFLPPAGTQAPAIARFQAFEAEFRPGGAEVVALGFGEFEEFVGYHGADGVQAKIIRADVAAAIAVKAGDRVFAAGFEFFAKYVYRFGHFHV